MQTLAAAREPILRHERERVYQTFCGIAVLATLDVIADPASDGATAQAVRDFLNGADAPSLAVLLEAAHARDAHAIVQALARVGIVGPETARVAHARIDARARPEPSR